MALSDADKQQIIEEEQLRARIRAEQEQKTKKKGISCVNILGLMILCSLCVMLMLALTNVYNKNVNEFNRTLSFDECINNADKLSGETKDKEYKLCVNEYKDILQTSYSECKETANQQRTQEFINRELQKCEEDWGKYLMLTD